jgi:hypothetical protein
MPMPAEFMQPAPVMQSVFDAHGNAHFPYCRLQRCVPQCASSVHGSASGPGMLSTPSCAGGGAEGSTGGASRVTVFDGAAEAGGIGGT